MSLVLDAPAAARAFDRLVAEPGVADDLARIVAGTETPHRLLPDLVPPKDRAWTGTFSGSSVLDDAVIGYCTLHDIGRPAA